MKYPWTINTSTANAQSGNKNRKIPVTASAMLISPKILPQVSHDNSSEPDQGSMGIFNTVELDIATIDSPSKKRQRIR